MSKELKQFLLFSVVVLVVSIGYYLYAPSVHPPSHEQETFLSEFGGCPARVSCST